MIKIPTLVSVNLRVVFNITYIFNPYSFINIAVGYMKRFHSIQGKKHLWFNVFVLYINYSTALHCWLLSVEVCDTLAPI